MATKRKAVEVDQATGSVKDVVKGLNLANAVDAIKAAQGRKFKKSGKVRVIVEGGKDFEMMGAEMAAQWLETDAEIKAAMADLHMQANATRGLIWLGVAMQIGETDKPAENAETVRKAFAEAMKAKGHKRAGPDASDFKTFVLAYLKAPAEVIGALADTPNYHDAMKELRQIKNDGATKSRGSGSRKPTDKQMQALRKMIGNCDLKQLEQVYKCGVSRAKALRVAGEVFGFFK